MLKKIFTLFVKIAIVVLTVILVSLLVARKIFPPEKIKQLAISQIESTINRRVTVDRVWFNPFKGLSLENVIIRERTPFFSETGDSTWFLKVKTIVLNYRFLALLKREIEIHKVFIDSPVVNLVQNSELQWNFADLIKPDTTAEMDTTEIIPDTAATEFALPLSLDLKTFSLKNIQANIYMNQVDTVLSIKTGGLTINFNDLYIPRYSLDAIKRNARASLQIVSDKSPWQYTLYRKSSSQTTEINAELQMDVQSNLNGFNDFTTHAVMTVSNVNLINDRGGLSEPIYKKFHLPRLLSIVLNFKADMRQETLNLHRLAVEMGEETLFDMKGEVSHLLGKTDVNLSVTHSEIKLQQVFESFSPLLPDSLQNELQDVFVTGIVSLRGTEISGSPFAETPDSALAFNLQFSVNDLFAEYPKPASQLSDMDFKMVCSGVYAKDGLQETRIRVNISVDSMSVTIDSVRSSFAGLTSDFLVNLDHNLFPTSLKASLDIADFFDVPLNMTLAFNPIDKFNNYQASAKIIFKELPLSSLPLSPAEGYLDLVFEAASRSLDQIDVDLKIISDIIEVETDDEPLIIYPFDIVGNLALSTDTSFQKITLDRLEMRISDFVNMFMHGDFLLEPEFQFHAFIDELSIDHEKILEVVPEQLLEGLEGLTVTGRSELTSEIFVALPAEKETPQIDLKGKINLSAGVRYPEQYFTLGLLKSEIDFYTNGISGEVSFKSLLDSIVVVGIQDEPLRNISVLVDVVMPDFETVQVESASVVIPDFKAHFSLTATIDNLTGQMKAHGNSLLFLNAENDTVSLLNVLKLTGDLTQEIEMNLNDSIADIKGSITFKPLSIKYDELVQIDSVMGKIYFTQKIDIEQGVLIETKKPPRIIANGGAFYYDLLRPYYMQGDRFSHVYIRRIEAMDYHVEHLNVDLIVENERIEIPRFTMNLYDGNMSGLINANLHDGNLDEIEWKVKATLSRMNSAKLLPASKGKRRGSDLNMNLELFGKGVDPAGELEVGGYLYVTKIGPRFTDNVLRSLDPKGTDKSIQDTRKLLKWGYIPKLISCEIKHGNLYPSIHLVKGNILTKLIPLSISGGKIELARIPIQFFLENLEFESQ